MNRRRLIRTAAACSAAGAPATLARDQSSSRASDSPLELIDTNANLFHWPFRRLPLDSTGALLKKMKALQIRKAFAGSFEGVLRRDLAAVNRRLFRECQRHDALIPIGAINPNLPGWRSDFQRCVDEFQMPGIRIHPNYHGYELASPKFDQLLELAAAAKVFVQIAAVFEDVRTQPEQLRIPDVDLAPLTERARGRIQILNGRPRPATLENLAPKTEISFDIARVEGTDGIAKLLQSIPAERVLLGTHAPFLIPEAALIRLDEAAITAAATIKITQGNAEALLAQQA